MVYTWGLDSSECQFQRNLVWSVLKGSLNFQWAELFGEKYVTAFALVNEINLDVFSMSALGYGYIWALVSVEKFLQKSVPEHLEFKNWPRVCRD